jgi:hypothetical protein
MAKLTFEQIVRADLEIDAIVEYQAAMILSPRNLRGVKPSVRRAIREHIVGDLSAARAVCSRIGWGKQIARQAPEKLRGFEAQ